MLTKKYCFLALCFLLASGGSLLAEPCELGPSPAATLLLPYFEVEYDNPNGLTTLFSIHNAFADPALVHVTFWTDYAIPTIDFDIFLTGYDVTTVNLRDVFRHGRLPITVDDSSDPDDSISPHGDPAWDGDFPLCDDFLPFYDPEMTIPQSFLDWFQESHTGQYSEARDGCLGSDYGDGRARGYITIDNANQCSVMYPSDEGYFGDRGTGIASNANQLWGDFIMIDQAQGFAQGEPLVHIQAFDGVGEEGAWSDGDFTFYSRYVGNSAIDNREPLVSVSANRFLDGGPFEGGTELLIWRDTRSASVEVVACDSQPPWYPLYQRRILFFDEEENLAETCGFICGVCSPPNPAEACVRLATQRMPVTTGSTLFPPFQAGWMYMDLSISDPWHQYVGPSQSWTVTLLSASNQFSVAMPAIPLVTACEGEPPTPLNFF